MLRTLRARRRQILSALTALVPLVIASSASAANRNWGNGAGGSWQTAANWPNGLPVGGDVAIFGLGDTGYTVSFAAHINDVALLVRNDRLTFDLDAGVAAFWTFNHADLLPFVIGENPGQDGRLTFIRGLLNTVDASARTLGQSVDTSGQLTIGTGGNWTATSNITHEVNVGLSGNGAVIIQDGGRGNAGVVNVGRNLTASGSFTVTGPASTFTIQTLRVGQEGAGSLLVSSGASLTLNGASVIGNTATSSGVMTVTGLGSAVAAASFAVGGQGDGSLTVSNGARFASIGEVDVASASGGGGSVAITGAGSRMSVAQAFNLNDATAGPATASLHISAGGALTTGPATLARSAGNNANALVTGTGSSWNVATDLFVGHGGDASLTIADGASVTAPAQTTFGQLFGASGQGRITGPGATLNATGGLTIGNIGNGSLAIDSGGRVNSASLSVAGNPFSRSTIDVSGTGSVLNVIGGMALAHSGVGAITVRDGARATTEELVIVASGALGNGTLRVSGPGTFFDASTASSDGIELAHFGNGTLIVEGGASLRTPTLFTAAGHANARASVTVTGPGSSLSIINADGGLFISGDGATPPVQGGATTFTVSDRASLTVNGRLSVIRNSTLAITSGAAASVEQTSGKLTVFNSSSLLIDDATLTVGNAGIDNFGETRLANSARIAVRPGAQPSFSNSGLLSGDGRIDPRLVNQATGEVRVSPGQRLHFAFPLANTNHGELNLLGGTLEFSALLTNSSTGRISGRGTLIAPSLDNEGRIHLSSGISDFFTILNNTTANSETTVSGGASATFYSPVNNVPGSEFHVSQNSTATFFAHVTGSNFFSGPGTVNFEAGSSTVGALSVGSARVAPLASLDTSGFRTNSLTVEGTMRVLLNSPVSRTASLSIPDGGSLDLANNDLILDNADLAATLDHFTSGRLFTSAATPISTLAIVKNDAGAGAPLHTTFSGESVDASDVLVKYTYTGDANLDGRVSISDFFSADRGRALRLSGWQNGDFNHSGGFADATDFMLLDRAFLSQGGPLALPPSFPAPVPEPAILPLLLLASSLLIRRRADVASPIHPNN